MSAVVNNSRTSIPDYVKNDRFKAWFQEMVELCKPDAVHWCDGSVEEYQIGRAHV